MNFDWIKNSTKNKFAFLAAASEFLYAFLVFIIFGFGSGAAFWISLIFAMVAIALAYYVAYLSVKKAKRMSDWLFSAPVIRWCSIYVVIELIVATIFMIISAPWRLVFIPQFLLPILFVIVVVPCFVQKSHAAEVKQETVVKVSYVRQMNAKLLALIPRAEDPAIKKEIEKAADMLRHSDPMSADSLVEVENKLMTYVDQLDALVRSGNYAEAAPVVKEICLLIDERSHLAIAAKLVQH